MGAASGLPSIFFSDLLDESKMYVIGGWPSQEAHQKGFNGSEEQAKLIEGIKGLMDIEWMEYVDLEIGKLGQGGRLEAECLVAIVLGCGYSEVGNARGFVEGLCKEQAGTDAVMGWNLKKKEKEREENYLVLFEGFEGLEKGREMGESVKREMEKTGKGDSVKVVHMRRIVVEGNGVVP